MINKIIQNKNKKKSLFVYTPKILFIFLFSILLFNFVGAVEGYDKPPKKSSVDFVNYDTGLFNPGRNNYKSDFVEVDTHGKNTIDLETSIFSHNYLSVGNYKKGKSDEKYNIKFYTGNDGVNYTLYKTDLVGVSKSKVRETANIKVGVQSKDGYVYYNTSSFSTLFLSMPDILIPFHNLVSLDLREYFGSNINHYEIVYKDPLFEKTNGTDRFLKIDNVAGGFWGAGSLNTDTFELDIYDVGGNSYLDVFVYDTFCNDEITNTSADCFYEEEDINIFLLNSINVFGCGSDETVTISLDEEGWSQNCTYSDVFKFNTPKSRLYYRSALYNGNKGLHNDMIEHFSFNEYFHDGANSELLGRWDTTLTNNGSSYTTVNEFKAGGYEGGAFDFDGLDDYIDTNTDYLIDINNDFSVSLWIKTTDTTSNAIPFGSLKEGGSIDPRITIRTNVGGSGYLGYQVQGDTGGAFSSDAYGDINDNTWHHIVFNVNTTSQNLYLDGSLLTSGTGNTGTITLTNNDFWLGALNTRNLATGQIDALIDEVSIFDKFLTTDEITYLYNSGNGRDFFNLNEPNNVVDGICFGINSTECGSLNPLGYLESNVTTTIYLSNYFSYPNGPNPATESFNVSYYNFDLSQFETLQNGQCSAFGELYDLCLGGDQLNITTYSNDVYRGFEGELITAFNNLGFEDSIYFSVFFPVSQTGPPEQLQALPLLTFNQSVNNDTKSLNMNTYAINYNALNVTYTDLINDTLTDINLYLLRNNESVLCSEGNIKVCLDGTDVQNNIIVNISEIDNKTYNGRVNFYWSNSNDTITDFIDIQIGTDLKLSNIANQTVTYEEMVCIDSKIYFTEFNYTTINFEYNNVSYEQEWFINYGLVGPPEAITNETQAFTAYLTELGIFCFTAKSVDLNQSFSISVRDLIGNFATQNFYIFVSSSIPMTEAQTYLYNIGNWLSGLFPEASTLTGIEKIGIIVIVLLILTIGSIGFLYKSMGVNSLYVAVGLDILAFLLFLGLGYVSVGFMVFVALSLIALTYLKIKS